jgi:hypothetical protein
MIDRASLRIEPVLAASPVWIQLRDTFTGRPPAGPVSVALERRTGATWVALAHPHQLSPTGSLAFVDLGRTRDPGTVAPFDVRVTVASPGTITEAWNGDAALTTTITPWASSAPSVPSIPDSLRLFPSPAYAFPTGTPLLAGRVVDVNGDPVDRARVWATETVQAQQLTEEVRSDDDGRFRLPLRWSAGATDVHAARGAISGAVTVTVPADLSTTHQIVVT